MFKLMFIADYSIELLLYKLYDNNYYFDVYLNFVI